MTRHVHCEADLRAGFDVDVHVTEVPPLVDGGWTQRVVCPHGTAFFVEPTGEQIAAWNQAAHS